MQFTYATARSLVSASVVAKGLSTTIPVIAYNGALIIHPDTGEVISSLSFSEEEACYVRDVCRQMTAIPLFIPMWTAWSGFPMWQAGRMRASGIILDARKGDKRFRPLPDETCLYRGDIFYFTSHLRIGRNLLLCMKVFAGDGRFRCTLQQEMYRPEYFLEIMPKKASKGRGDQTVKRNMAL